MRVRSLLCLLVPAAVACSNDAGGGRDGGPDPSGDGGFADAATSPDAEDFFALRLQFVDPDSGPFAGGTEITVRGNGFTEDTVVLIGGREVEPLDYEYIDSRRILVHTPPGEPGAADVEVREGGDTATLDDGFTYEAIYADPPSGSVAGGTFVTLTGFGTDFTTTALVTFDGLPVTGLEIVNDQVLTAHTPPGVAGDADIRIVTDSGVFEAERGYTYRATADPFAGGFGGGPIDDTVNVVVLDARTDNGIDGAYVVLGDPATSPYRGYADGLGQITFSGPGIEAPVSVHASAPGYEIGSFVSFDARDVSISLRSPPPPPDPEIPPFPPAPQVGHIFGHVLFGDATGLGSPHWNLVPAPRTPTERKRVFVTTTASSMFSSTYPPQDFIDYQGFDPDTTAWEFDVFARPRALAVVAIAGLYDPEKDPSGTGVTGFEPFAMGVTRGVLVGPGEDVMHVDVVVNIPLDTAVRVDLDAPPALGTPGWDGPIEYQIRPYVDLGGEGVIAMNKNGLPNPPAPEERPNVYGFADGATSILLPAMAPLTGSLADASYSFVIGAYAENGTSPFSVRIASGVGDVSLPATIGEFLGTVRPADPLPDQVGSSAALRIYSEAPSDGAATFNIHLLTASNGDPLARIITRGDVLDVDIPDLTEGGLPGIPRLEDVSWTVWRIRVPGASFDDFTYRWLSALSWEAYTATAQWVQFPAQP